MRINDKLLDDIKKHTSELKELQRATFEKLATQGLRVPEMYEVATGFIVGMNLVGISEEEVWEATRLAGIITQAMTAEEVANDVQ